MNLSIEAQRLLQQLWHCHSHNPVNHYEYLPGEEGGAILHPASRERVETSAVAVDELVQAGLLRGRTQLSFTFEGIRYGQRRRAGR